VAKRLPRYPVPAALLGRLAVQQASQGQKLGEFLVFDAFANVVKASKVIAIHALVVDAMFDSLVPWYRKFGFQEFPTSKLRLFISVATLSKAVQAA
jgi:predicted N-acetyltransferase YhbS